MARLRAAVSLVLAAAALAGCARRPSGAGSTVRFWGFGREGEVVRELIPEFERRNPGIRLSVQQIPWTSAHEKLLTAVVGRATPDVAQLGNTWIPEFAAIGSLEPLDRRIATSAAVAAANYFPGVWETSVYECSVYGIPWYVDTRVLFYRPDLLARVGFRGPPRDWAGWREAMRRVKTLQPSGYAILLPTNEWEQITLLGIQQGSPLLCEDGTRGCFARPEFARAVRFYVDLFQQKLAPIVSYTALGNAYQEFARGTIAMWITGPWNLGEFRRRLPAGQQDLWMTTPLPAPQAADWPGASFAGGSSLAVFQASRAKDAAWKVVEFLADPAIQSRFYALSGDLPAHTASWQAPSLAADPKARAFREQLEHVAPMPRVPEWEQIAQKLAERLEPAIRGRQSVAESLALLDADVDQILTKRRWLVARSKGGSAR
ncbi:MAG: sugar ABC transporter substrate-binding protein [Acidobacteriota bacterium]